MKRIWIIGALTLIGPLALAAEKKPPETKRAAVSETYHGTSVVDEYRWLEASDDEVKAWSDAQNAHARSYLDRLPHAAEIKKRISEILKSRPAEYVVLAERKGRLFALKVEPPKQQPMLVVLRSPDDRSSEKMILDPNKLNTKGTTAIDFYRPSLDGKRVAVSLSENGSEDGTVHVYDVDTATEVGEPVPRVNGGTAGGSVAFNADGSGFWYTRYPRNQERPPEDMAFYQQVYFHKIGTPTESDVYAIGKDFPRIAEIELETSDDGAYVLARVANGDGGEFAHYVFDGKSWKQITQFKDKVIFARFGRDAALYLLSRDGAPRGKILRLPLATLDLAKAKLIVPQSEGTIESYAPSETKLYVVDLLGGPSDIRVFSLAGKLEANVPVPPVSSVSEVVREDKDEILFRGTSYIDAPAWYRYSADDASVKKTALFRTAVVDYSDTEVLRETAVSKDGTKVPINIIRKKSTRLDGKNPTILYGYGGYGVSMTPAFREDVRVWIEQGGVYAVANLRGGGEFGEEWHHAGNLTKKQNVFDDFFACAEHLISSGYTRPEKLAILGGSNGGLLMGAALTQHPDLFGAVVSQVGIYDMLRVELTNNGAFNVTEFGSVKDPDQFKALYAYSPYHHVKDGVRYPATLFMTGANDPRVDPWHSRKMAARLQAASASKKPILLRTDDAGHGFGTSLDVRVSQVADLYAFAFSALGVKYDLKLVGKLKR
jgi:prolyl oligopeptidase